MKFNREPPAVLTRLAAEPRFAAGTMEQRHANKKKGGEGRRWRIFLLRSEGDLHAAIEWLAEAHRLAKPAKSKDSGPRT